MSELLQDPTALLDFWFGDLAAGFANAAHRRRWFRGGQALDDTIRRSFSELPAWAAAGRLEHWRSTATGELGYILVCDQLPRHLFRGTAQAFAWDSLALAASRTQIATRADQALAFDQQAFCYLPFSHSELLADQDLAVELFRRLRDATPAAARSLGANWLASAVQHRDIIRTFGRFPHRNSLLGRRSSDAELTYLERASGFGQSARANTRTRQPERPDR